MKGSLCLGPPCQDEVKYAPFSMEIIVPQLGRYRLIRYTAAVTRPNDCGRIARSGPLDAYLIGDILNRKTTPHPERPVFVDYAARPPYFDTDVVEPSVGSFDLKWSNVRIFWSRYFVLIINIIIDYRLLDLKNF